jgi:hypothetical protein
LVVRFHNIGLDLKKGNLAWIQFSIFNPASINATLTNLTGPVYINDEYVGKVINYNQTLLISRSDTITEVSFVPNLFGIVAIPKIIIEKRFKVRCELNIELNGVGFPYVIEEGINLNKK